MAVDKPVIPSSAQKVELPEPHFPPRVSQNGFRTPPLVFKKSPKGKQPVLADPNLPCLQARASAEPQEAFRPEAPQQQISAPGRHAVTDGRKILDLGGCPVSFRALFRLFVGVPCLGVVSRDAKMNKHVWRSPIFNMVAHAYAGLLPADIGYPAENPIRCYALLCGAKGMCISGNASPLCVAPCTKVWSPQESRGLGLHLETQQIHPPLHLGRWVSIIEALRGGFEGSKPNIWMMVLCFGLRASELVDFQGFGWVQPQI